jgi:hypothetical protein
MSRFIEAEDGRLINTDHIVSVSQRLGVTGKYNTMLCNQG